MITEINGQIFINTKWYTSTKHKSRSFYNKLKNHYCKKKGFTMCDAWLDFQNFAIFWDNNIPDTAIVKLDQSKKIIDRDSIIIFDTHNKM